MNTVVNPIIRGFNPDPSICKVEGIYYLVTSTFEFFPGITLYRSADLASWEMIGHCVNDSDTMPLYGCRPSGGLYAPTIRYHKGYFFITCTNTTDKGNFVIYTDDPMGSWKGPFWIKQGGIDPSLFFDNDGKCYLQSSVEHDGTHHIFQCEINPFTGEMLTESIPITMGFGGKYPEAPHMYSFFNKYYLLLAEGGTEYGHMVTLFRGDSPWGPFEGCPGNPILTHRDLKAQYNPFQCVGHADIVQDNENEWWLVALGIRRLPNNLLHNLGRETFLAKLEWNDQGWPIVNQEGILTEKVELQNKGNQNIQDFEDDFSCPEFPVEYLFLRKFNKECYERKSGQLVLRSADSINSVGSPTLACVRQKEWKAVAEAGYLVRNEAEFEAGLTAYYCDDQHYDLIINKNADAIKVEFKRTIYNISETKQIEIKTNPSEKIVLQIEADDKEYCFFVKTQTEKIKMGSASICGLCTEISSKMTFTGTMFGIFCEKGEAVATHFSVHY